MKPLTRMTVLLAVLLLLGPETPARCADERPAPPLVGRVELRFQRCRSRAPIPIVWEIEWNGKSIAQGDLQYEVDDGNQTLGHFQLPDLVLSPGKNVFNDMLPTMSVFRRSTPVTIHARFVRATKSFEFEEQSLRVPNRFDQWFNVGVVSGVVGKPAPEESRLMAALHWERLLPSNDGRDRSTTVSIDVAPSDLPTDPLTLCNFDVVVLFPAALTEIRDNQVYALKKWVAAGGSLCLIAGGGLTARHTAFINDLMSESAGPETFSVDARGFLSPGEEHAGEIVMARRGLGRVVVLRQALAKKLAGNERDWLAATVFLMKAHREVAEGESRAAAGMFARDPRTPNWGQPPRPLPQANTAKKRSRPNRSGTPAASTNPNTITGPQFQGGMIQLAPAGTPPNFSRGYVSPTWRMPYDPTYAMTSDLAPAPFASISGLYQLLMPRDVQMVPLHLIAAVLAAYVVAIGPLDYLLLGVLRRRRLTWILFPVVTIAFAVFTLWLSRWYLGTNDSRQGIEINDVVKGGAIARRTRIELLFLSRQREIATEIRNGASSQVGLGVAMDLSRFAMPSPKDRGPVDTASYVGRFPNRYVVGQSIPQWTPVVNRFFWIDPKDAKFETSPDANSATPFNWDDPGDITTPAGRTALSKRIESAFGKKACAVVYRSRGPEFVPILNSFEALRFLHSHGDPRARSYGIESVLRELSVRPPDKLFSLASQVSPNGSPELEDLAILDTADPRQTLLLVGVSTGQNLVLYRRLYAGGT